ncbi:MAG: gliding motility lipoprotein GldD [Bacteroidales bacterium]|nr:gliding motility lipoprotein GldD [Bacteroidales bacterium]
MKIIKVTIFFCLFFSCSNPIPKPSEYFRIDFPEKKYLKFSNKNCNFEFEYPYYSKVINDSSDSIKNPCWKNIIFPYFNATIYLTYYQITNNFVKLSEESRTLAYKHNIKADAIREILYSDTLNKIYGIVYEIKGNAASPVQFFMTDSVRHFLRGSLYFNTKPNKDSLAPVIEFISVDIKHLIETLRWK